MKRVIALLTLAACLVVVLAAPATAAPQPSRARGELWLTDPVRGDAYCIFEATAAFGTAGEPGYVPAAGHLRFVTATGERAYALDAVSISGTQAFLFGADPSGARILARAVDGGSPGAVKDLFGCGPSPMSILRWTIVSGNLVVRAR